jgi:hypothetical protein
MALRGYQFSVSVKSELAPEEKEGDDLACEPELKYSSITQALEDLGGKISNTVHKRVSFVVATKRARLRETQRVRKAAKLGIRILDADAVSRACESGSIKSVNDLDAFIADFVSTRVVAKSSGKSTLLPM